MAQTLEERLQANTLLDGNGIRRLFKASDQQGSLAGKVFLITDGGDVLMTDKNDPGSGFSYATTDKQGNVVAGTSVADYVEDQVRSAAGRDKSVKALEKIAAALGKTSPTTGTGKLYEQQLVKAVKKCSYEKLPAQFDEFITNEIARYQGPKGFEAFGKDAAWQAYRLDIMNRPQAINEEGRKNLTRIARRVARAQRRLKRSGLADKELTDEESFLLSPRKKLYRQELQEAEKLLGKYRAGVSLAGEEAPRGYMNAHGLKGGMINDARLGKDGGTLEIDQGPLAIHVNYTRTGGGQPPEKRGWFGRKLATYALAGLAGIGLLYVGKKAIDNYMPQPKENTIEMVAPQPQQPLEKTITYEEAVARQGDHLWGLARKRHPQASDQELMKIVDSYATANGKNTLTEYHRKKQAGVAVEKKDDPNHIMVGDTLQLPLQESIDVVVEDSPATKPTAQLEQRTLEKTLAAGYAATAIGGLLSTYQGGKGPVKGRFDRKAASEEYMDAMRELYASGSGTLTDVRAGLRDHFGMDASESTISRYARQMLCVGSRREATTTYSRAA